MKTLLLFFILIFNIFADENFELQNNVKYGKDLFHTLDIYIPKKNLNKKAIFMVHGGAWKYGDKASSTVVENKLNYWGNKGYIFISVNYRLQPNTDIKGQANDIAKAFSFAQKRLKEYEIDSKDIILMGHSAGAHLISLLATNTRLQKEYNIEAWLGTISLDTAALNVVAKMQSKHPKLYDNAFGDDIIYWKDVSPFHLMNSKIIPFLAVCSTKRKVSCKEAENFVQKALGYDSKASILRIDLRHKKINEKLGQNSKYTDDVNRFIISL